MAGIAERVYVLIRDTVEQQGVSLWDVRFVKEGASHYLRIFIDKPEGVSIDDCTNVSHAVDPLLDDADPIDCTYYLEVCSPGIERELTREEHFSAMTGRTVCLKLFRPRDGMKEFTGALKAYGGNIVLETNGAEISFERNEVSKVVLCEDI